MSKTEGPVKVGKLLGGFLEKSGLREPLRRVEAVEDWPDRVGEAVGRVTRAKEIRERALIVEVKSSAWLMELNLMKSEILRRVNEGRSEALIETIIFVLAEDTAQ